MSGFSRLFRTVFQCTATTDSVESHQQQPVQQSQAYPSQQAQSQPPTPSANAMGVHVVVGGANNNNRVVQQQPPQQLQVTSTATNPTGNTVLTKIPSKGTSSKVQGGVGRKTPSTRNPAAIMMKKTFSNHYQQQYQQHGSIYHRVESFATPPPAPIPLELQLLPTVSQPVNPNKYAAPKRFSDLYRLGEKLGEGGFAVVHIATAIHHDSENQQHKQVAVKIAKLEKIKDKDTTAIRREFRILKGLDHRNIVKALGLYEEQHHFYFVLEFVCGGELFDRIVLKKQYFEKEARDAIRSVLRAIEYFHKHDIVHRDLKPENLLLTTKDDNADVKVADFGLAKMAEGNSITERVGTSQYLAPEVVEGRASGKGVDMWAAGVILFILLGGYSPFRNKDPQIMFADICKGKFKFHPQRWSNVSEEAKDLIRSLLTVDQNVRLTATQALAHPWIRADDDLLLEKELTDNLETFRQFNAARKLKAGVHVVRTVNMFLKAVNQKKLSSLRQEMTNKAKEMSNAEAPASDAAADSLPKPPGTPLIQPPPAIPVQ